MSDFVREIDLKTKFSANCYNVLKIVPLKVFQKKGMLFEGREFMKLSSIAYQRKQTWQQTYNNLNKLKIKETKGCEGN